MPRLWLVAMALLAMGARASAKDIVDMTNAERRSALEKMSPEEQEAIFESLSFRELLRIGRTALAELGVYRFRLVKQERVKGELLEPQEIIVHVREKPLAVRMKYVKGPAKGRKVLYSAAIREKEVLLREAGILGITSIWLDIDGSLTRKDSNHPVTRVGFGALFSFFDGDLDRIEQHGGFQKRPEGFDGRGGYCMTFTLPKAAKLPLSSVRLCCDARLGLLTKVETHDGEGLLERLEFFDIAGNQKVGADFFTPEKAGL